MNPIGRLYLCACCRKQTIICSPCDRNQIYCSSNCAQSVRRQSVREAGRRYQTSDRGRLAHAQRMRRYRARQENVTHQGSSIPSTDDKSSPPDAECQAGSITPPMKSIHTRPWHCQACGRICSEFVRNGFLLPHRIPDHVRQRVCRTSDGHSPP